jgi:hypothetical protein
VRDISIIVKQDEKPGAFRTCSVLAAIVLVLMFCVSARAAVKDDVIEEVPGLSFENVIYDWNKVVLDVVNTTTENMLFGGTMIFLDRRGKPVAKASIMPKKIAGLKLERYTAHFFEGSGESARRAARVIWDFGAQ